MRATGTTGDRDAIGGYICWSKSEDGFVGQQNNLEIDSHVHVQPIELHTH